MSEIYDRQKMQEELQRSSDFSNIFAKVVSGKPGYKSVIEVKPITTKCKNCGTILEEKQKFCHECGAKAEKKED